MNRPYLTKDRLPIGYDLGDLAPDWTITDPVVNAISIMGRAHRGQVDKAGEPYLFHPLRVGISLLPDVDSVLVGIFHDVVEDCDPRWHREVQLFVGEELFKDVLALSQKKAEGESYEDYIARCAAAGPRARKVKLADLRDNLDGDRLARARARGTDVDRLIKKYAYALEVLYE